MVTKERGIRGKIISDMLKSIGAISGLGTKTGDGVARKKLIERPWQYFHHYVLEIINRKNYQMEWLSPRDGNHKIAILQLHGGGYVGPISNAYRLWARWYSTLGEGADVLTVDYRVAPQFPFPAAHEDAIDAYKWLLDEGYKGEQIIIVGDSAGGGLGLGLVHYLKKQQIELPCGMVLMSPWTDLTLSGESIKSNFTVDVVFGNKTTSLLTDCSYIGESNPKNPYMSPLFGDFSGFPPMLIQVGGNEMLLSDAKRLAEKAKKAGVRVRYSEYKEMFHVFQMGMGLMKESNDAWKEVREFFRVIESE